MTNASSLFPSPCSRILQWGNVLVLQINVPGKAGNQHILSFESTYSTRINYQDQPGLLNPNLDRFLRHYLPAASVFKGGWRDVHFIVYEIEWMHGFDYFVVNKFDAGDGAESYEDYEVNFPNFKISTHCMVLSVVISMECVSANFRQLLSLSVLKPKLVPRKHHRFTAVCSHPDRERGESLRRSSRTT